MNTALAVGFTHKHFHNPIGHKDLIPEHYNESHSHAPSYIRLAKLFSHFM
jgi:hypothetical protein